MSDALLQRLIKRLASLGFRHWSTLDEASLLAGQPFAFGVLFRFLLEEAFREFTLSFIHRAEWFCVESDDVKLALAVLRMMNVEFAYRAPITPLQMGKTQFFAAKAQVVLDLITFLTREQSKRHQAGKPPHNRSGYRGEGDSSLGRTSPSASSSRVLTVAAEQATNATGRCSNCAPPPRARTQPFLEEKAAAEYELKLRALDLRRRELNRLVRIPAAESTFTDDYDQRNAGF